MKKKRSSIAKTKLVAKKKARSLSKKTTKNVMAETFVMVSFSFIFGTILAGGFLWFIVKDLTKQVHSDVSEQDGTGTEDVTEKNHYDTSSFTENDYDLIDNIGTLEVAVTEYCSGVYTDDFLKEVPECPADLELLIPNFLESVDEVGGDLSVFVYDFVANDFELNVRLSDGAKELMKNDGGDNDVFYEIGTNLKLIH